MHPFPFILAAAALPAETITVTAAREAVPIEEAAVSATVFERERIDSLGLPLTADLLRLAPGLSVASTGPRGTQTQLRIRGAEANHSLLFVDGIRFNDPAAGNEARFELLASDSLSRVEIVRGPQSALWGSEALGGVVAVETADPLRAQGFGALAEYGSLDSARLAAEGAIRLGDFGVSGSAGLLRSDGIDSFGANGERDGFENVSASLKAVLSPLPSAEIGLAGHFIDAASAYDGFDPVTFRRADTPDATDNRLFALRGWVSHAPGPWSLLIDGSYLESENRNRLGGQPLNRTSGQRFTLGGQLSRSFGIHRVTAAVEHEAEDFRARDRSFFGASDQDRSRRLTAFVGQWRAAWSEAFIIDAAVRHDRFSAFEDATTFRASALLRPRRQWTLHAAYGEGLAQPTFYDLHGFFPGSFVGNPRLRPESSRGWEIGFEWRWGHSAFGVTGFSNRLQDEIVDVFDAANFLSSTANVEGRSRRRGIEVEAHSRLAGMNLSANYTHLDASEGTVAGGAALREVRRPKHSANLLADGRLGALSWGASLAYVGARRDTDFDLFPAQAVTLGDYVLASLRLGYRIAPAIEAYGRVENAFDAAYQDVVGYHTPGRTVHAGLRLRFGA